MEEIKSEKNTPNPTSMQTQKPAVINISKEIMERIFICDFRVER